MNDDAPRNPLATVLAIIGRHSPKAEREILAALGGDARAISENFKQMERLRHAEENEDH